VGYWIWRGSKIRKKVRKPREKWTSLSGYPDIPISQKGNIAEALKFIPTFHVLTCPLTLLSETRTQRSAAACVVFSEENRKERVRMNSLDKKQELKVCLILS